MKPADPTLDLTITIRLPSNALGPMGHVEAWLTEMKSQGIDVTIDGPSAHDLDRALELLVKDLDQYVVDHPDANVSSERARIDEIRRTNAFLRTYGRPIARPSAVD